MSSPACLPRLPFPLAVAACACGLAFAATPAAAAVAATLRPYVDSGVLAGAVTLVADGERVLSLEAVGHADRAAGRPMRTDDVFWIASMSKPITAAAVMMLVDEGRLSLDDRLDRHLPEFKGLMVVAEKDAGRVVLQAPRQPVTLRHLLSHTSGMSFKSGIEEPTLDLHPLATRVRSYAMMPLEFEPGSRYQYSNAGINTAGRIVEVVSGLSFAEFLDRRLFGPLEMTDTTFRPSPAQIARLAKSYRGNADRSGLAEVPIAQVKYPLDDPAREPFPAGGLFSTARDCARFGQLMLNRGRFAGRRLLSEAAVAEMSRRQTPASVAQSYGLGFQTRADSFSHGGAYSTNLAIDQDRGLVTVFLVQNAGWLNDEGRRILPAFQQAVRQAFPR